MTVQTKTGTLAEAEQTLAELQRQHQAKQVEVIQLGHALAGLDKDPESGWTGLLVSEREANKRNWTKERAQAQQALQGLARDVETQQANVQQMRRRLVELPKVIERLTFAISPKGNYGVEVYKAEQALLICQQRLAQEQQRLRVLEDELQTLGA